MKERKKRFKIDKNYLFYNDFLFIFYQLIGGALIGIGVYALIDQWQTGDGVRVADISDILFNVGLIIAIIGAVIFFVSFAGNF